MRRLLIAIAMVMGGLVWAWSVLPTIKLPDDVRSAVERYATKGYGRPVTIGSLHINLRNPFYFEMTDLHLANPAWASVPDMIYIGHATGVLDLMPLLKGRVRFQSLMMEDGRIVLERNKDGLGNWKPDRMLGHTLPKKTVTELHEAALRDRQHVPVVLKLVIRNSWITFRTSSGMILKIDLNNTVLSTPADNQPVTLIVNGAYNAIPVDMNVVMESFDALHDGDKPFHADIIAKGAGGVIDLRADMMDPLNFDNYQSRLKVDFSNLGQMAEIFGTKFRADMRVSLSSSFQRDDDAWKLDGIKGKFSDSTYAGDVQLNEGTRLHPDRIKTALDFNRLDIGKILKQTRARKILPHKVDKPILEVEKNPGILLDAALGAEDVLYKKIRVADLKLHAFINPGSVAVNDVSGGFLGGHVRGDIQLSSEDTGTRITTKAEITDADLKKIFELAGAHAYFLTGRLNARADLASVGNTPDEAERNGHGFMVVTMDRGAVSTKIMRQVSTDVRGLFGYPTGMSPISCMLSVVTIKDQTLSLSPFRIRTSDGTLFGAGQLNLKNDNLDFQFKTDSGSTSFFALDLPISLTGPVDTPSISPRIFSDIVKRKAASRENLRQLPPDFDSFVAGNGCRQ